MGGRLRLLLACLATAVLVVPLGWAWWSSLVPAEYSTMDMGHAEHGGGPQGGHAGHGTSGAAVVDISTLRAADTGPADVRLELVARKGTVPGPTG